MSKLSRLTDIFKIKSCKTWFQWKGRKDQFASTDICNRLLLYHLYSCVYYIMNCTQKTPCSSQWKEVILSFIKARFIMQADIKGERSWRKVTFVSFFQKSYKLHGVCTVSEWKDRKLLSAKWITDALGS